MKNYAQMDKKQLDIELQRLDSCTGDYGRLSAFERVKCRGEISKQRNKFMIKLKMTRTEALQKREEMSRTNGPHYRTTAIG